MHYYSFWFILYLLTGIISIICNSIVLYLAYDLSMLPKIYLSSIGLCKFMGFVQFYSLYAHIMAVFFVTLEYYCAFDHSEWLKRQLRKHATWLTFTVPFVTAFLFITDDYQPLGDVFCSVAWSDPTSSIWLFALIVPWLALIMIISVGLIWIILMKICRDPMLKLIFATPVNMVMFFYVLTTLLAVGPRVLMRVAVLFNKNIDEDENALLPVMYPCLLIGIIDFILSSLQFSRKDNNRTSVTRSTLSLIGMEDIMDGMEDPMNPQKNSGTTARLLPPFNFNNPIESR